MTFLVASQSHTKPQVIVRSVELHTFGFPEEFNTNMAAVSAT
jgi:hypothetical protein